MMAAQKGRVRRQRPHGQLSAQSDRDPSPGSEFNAGVKDPHVDAGEQQHHDLDAEEEVLVVANRNGVEQQPAGNDDDDKARAWSTAARGRASPTPGHSSGSIPAAGGRASPRARQRAPGRARESIRPRVRQSDSWSATLHGVLASHSRKLRSDMSGWRSGVLSLRSPACRRRWAASPARRTRRGRRRRRRRPRRRRRIRPPCFSTPPP